MRSLQDYRNIYAEIASSYGITGDSVELLVQLLANASYISEVENVSYVQEASLERATLVNSKIQHCMNQMYSVFRGRCPRVILKLKPTKYLDLNVYDAIVRSNDFTVYYLGYLSKNNDEKSIEGTDSLPLEEGFVYGPCKLRPALSDDDTYTIIGLIAKTKITEEWTVTERNPYYVETLEEGLSSDMYAKVAGDYYNTTRVFSDHILENKIFDLTTTSWSSRLYIPGIFSNNLLERNDEGFDPETTGLKIEATYYKFSKISDYKQAELKKINLSGTVMVEFDTEFLTSRGYSEIAPGVIIISEVPQENLNAIHYKASKDRYVGSIIRSNSDVGTVLEEMYPTKVLPGGTSFSYISRTSYEFSSGDSGSRVFLYYVPVNISNLLTSEEIAEFIETKKAYYITDNIIVAPGRQYTACFTIDLELYKPYAIDPEVSEILSTYSKRFGVDFSDSVDEIKTLISKISNVKQIKFMEIEYLDPNNKKVPADDLYDNNGNLLQDIYFKIEFNINSIIQTRS